MDQLDRSQEPEAKGQSSNDDANTLGLDEVIGALSRDLKRAQRDAAEEGAFGLYLSEAIVELQFTVERTRTNEGKAGVNFKVFGVGFGADGSIGSGSSDERMQRITLTLVPGHQVARDHPEGLRELVFAPPGSVPGPIAVVGENREGYEG